MNYELAKQLKDAGFPQHDRSTYECGDAGCPSYHSGPCIPTISELIEACGDGFKELVKNDDGSFECRDDYMDIETIKYKTPEEAVANLWLALNKK